MKNIKAVVFDFDGTLSHKRDNVWREIYESLGLPTGEGSSYRQSYVDFIAEKFDYAAWVKINEDDFKNGGLTKDIFDGIVSQTKLIDGLEETLKALSEMGIKLYVLSGNFVQLITKALDGLIEYFEEISANGIEFDAAGKISALKATVFDYKGKPDFLTKISKELKIKTSQICFVGNGENDVFAHESGAQTICINPENNCHKTADAWTYIIETCNNMTEILKYIK